MFQNATYIRDVYLYNKQSVQMGSWNTGGGDVLQTKDGGGPAYSTWNTVFANGKLHQWLTFFHKNMKFCILVVHDLSNDISYDTKLNRWNNCYFWGKIVKISWKKSREIRKIFAVPILLI